MITQGYVRLSFLMFYLTAGMKPGAGVHGLRLFVGSWFTREGFQMMALFDPSFFSVATGDRLHFFAGFSGGPNQFLGGPKRIRSRACAMVDSHSVNLNDSAWYPQLACSPMSINL